VRGGIGCCRDVREGGELPDEIKWFLQETSDQVKKKGKLTQKGCVPKKEKLRERGELQELEKNAPQGLQGKKRDLFLGKGQGVIYQGGAGRGVGGDRRS